MIYKKTNTVFPKRFCRSAEKKPANQMRREVYFLLYHRLRRDAI